MSELLKQREPAFSVDRTEDCPGGLRREGRRGLAILGRGLPSTSLPFLLEGPPGVTLVGAEPSPVLGGRKPSSSVSRATGPQACDPGVARQVQLWARGAVLGFSRDSVAPLGGCAAAGGPWRGHLPVCSRLSQAALLPASEGLPSCSVPDRQPDWRLLLPFRGAEPRAVTFPGFGPRTITLCIYYPEARWSPHLPAEPLAGLVSEHGVVQWLLFPAGLGGWGAQGRLGETHQGREHGGPMCQETTDSHPPALCQLSHLVQVPCPSCASVSLSVKWASVIVPPPSVVTDSK